MIFNAPARDVNLQITPNTYRARGVHVKYLPYKKKLSKNNKNHTILSKVGVSQFLGAVSVNSSRILMLNKN